MSSHKWYLEILGALILSKANAITNLIAFSLIVGGIFYFTQWRNMFFFAAASLGVLLVWHVVRTLTPIYCLRKQASRITWSQIILLASFGLWTLVVIKILDIGREAPSYIIITSYLQKPKYNYTSNCQYIHIIKYDSLGKYN